MGLDSVEYIMSLEDAFELEIPDADAAQIATPAQLIDYLCRRLGEVPTGPPLVQSAFYWLRRGLAEELALPRRTIHPASTVAQLTNRTEADLWRVVAERLAVQPKLLSEAPLLRWLATLVGGRDRTVGELAQFVAIKQPAAFKREADGWTRTQITEVVFRLLERQTGRQLGSAQLHSHLVHDLGLG